MFWTLTRDESGTRPFSPRTAARYDLDLSRIGDEELVVMAQECAYQPATDALIERHRQWACGLVARKAKLVRLAASDVEDAQQEAWFWMMEGIARYNTRELARPNGCRFRTFLQTVIRSRLLDFARRIWRRARHFECSQPALDAADRAGAVVRIGWLAGRSGSDPLAAALVWQENCRRLSCTLDRLGAAARDLWQGLAAGLGLRDIARQRGISYQQARGQRQRLLAKLKAEFRDDRDRRRKKSQKMDLPLCQCAATDG